jgi:phenolic acid decarboxylase
MCSNTHCPFISGKPTGTNTAKEICGARNKHSAIFTRKYITENPAIFFCSYCENKYYYYPGVLFYTRNWKSDV